MEAIAYDSFLSNGSSNKVKFSGFGLNSVQIFLSGSWDEVLSNQIENLKRERRYPPLTKSICSETSINSENIRIRRLIPIINKSINGSLIGDILVLHDGNKLIAENTTFPQGVSDLFSNDEVKEYPLDIEPMSKHASHAKLRIGNSNQKTQLLSSLSYNFIELVKSPGETKYFQRCR